MTHTNDNIAKALKSASTLPMPKELTEKIMASVEAEMASPQQQSKTQTFYFKKYAAAIALVCVLIGAGVFYSQQSANNTTLADNPNIDVAIPLEESHSEVARLVSPETPMNLLSQASGSNNSMGYLSEVGADPYASEEFADDPMMMMIGF